MEKVLEGSKNFLKTIKSDIEKYKQIAGPDQANNVAIVVPSKKQIKEIEVIHEEPLQETKSGIHGPMVAATSGVRLSVFSQNFRDRRGPFLVFCILIRILISDNIPKN